MRIEDTDPARHAGIEYPMEVGAPVFAPIKVTEENNFCIWGVVTYSIKNHKK